MALPSPEPFAEDALPEDALRKAAPDPATEALWAAAMVADRAWADAGDDFNGGVHRVDGSGGDRTSRPAIDPAVLWTEIVAGRLRPYRDRLDDARCYAILRATSRSSGFCYPMTDAEAAVLLRVLCGDQQKVISTDLAIAHSTASKRCAQALDKLDLAARTIPLPVIVAAQRAAGVVTNASIRQTPLRHEGGDYVVASIPRPQLRGRSPLTTSEQSIAQLLVEGRSRWQIAEIRETSVQTVSCQLRSIFAKFQSTGRYGLTRRAAELGWFDAG
jgi:DNA-binding NarL/FixJ family response regulator